MLVTNYSIRFRTAVFVFVLVFIIGGIVSYSTLPREGSPDVTIPYIFVTAIYEGVAPSEIEHLVTIPLEKQLNNLPNVKEITSTSMEGVSSVSIEFTPAQDIDAAIQKVKDKIDMARPDLPADLDEPVVRDFNYSTDFPVFSFTFSGESSIERLTRLAEVLEDRLEEISGVLQANVSGGREREIRVDVDFQRLQLYGIRANSVLGALHRENATVSGGNLERPAGDKFQVRVPGEFTSVSEIRQIVLASIQGRPVYLSDVAEVRDAFKDVSSISRVNGEPCVTVSVQKRTGENTVRIIEKVRALLDEQSLPVGVAVTVTQDESKDIAMMIAELENNVFSGFLLVVAVLMLFMGWRNSLLVALAIPFSMLISFVVLGMVGMTLNMMVLFGLVLALGMLVDNAIVIVENVFRHHAEGLSRIEAARRGASEVAWPVITSTVTTLAAFSPLLFWPGVMGDFMSYLPKTLICTLSASLFVAIVINPAVCSVMIGRSKHGVAAGDTREPHRFVKGYMQLLRLALRHRGVVVGLTVIVMLLTVASFGLWGKGVELFPETDPRACTIQVRYPEGTGIDRPDRVLRAIEQQLQQYEDVEYYQSTAGALSGGLTSGAAGTHVGSMLVRFVDFENRKDPSREVLGRIRDEMADFPGAEITVEEQEEGPPMGSPVSIELSGASFKVLGQLSRDVRATIRDVPGLVDVRDNFEDAKPELQFRVDRRRAALLGVDTRGVGEFIRTAVNGVEATRFRAGEDEYDITVRLPEGDRVDSSMFSRLSIASATGAMVPLSSIGAVSYAGGRGVIKRKDQRRTVTIDGNNQDRGVDKILADVRSRIDAMDIPAGYVVSYAGDTQEMKESGAFLAKAFLLAVGLILVVLVLQFNSVSLPGIIIVSVLLSLVGVVWGLIVCRMRFGVIMTGVGVISLAGIVVNNAIVLIDCIQQRRAEGMSVVDAVVCAGRLRLRPVLLTAATTVLGLIPMAVGYSLNVRQWPPAIVAGSETSAWWAPMAVAVIFGLGVATVLTLVLVPVMYSLSESMANGLRWYFRLGESGQAQPSDQSAPSGQSGRVDPPVA